MQLDLACVFLPKYKNKPNINLGKLKLILKFIYFKRKISLEKYQKSKLFYIKCMR